MINLNEYATKSERTGRWCLNSGSPKYRSYAETVQIVEACLYLGVPVTDVITSTAWHALVMKVAALEARPEETS